MPRMQTKQIVIRMTEDDYNLLKERVEKSGMSQADFLRKAILKKQIISTEGMKELLPELKRIGNNLNQIARACNQGEQMGAVINQKITAMQKELKEVWQLLRRSAQGRA